MTLCAQVWTMVIVSPILVGTSKARERTTSLSGVASSGAEGLQSHPRSYGQPKAK